MWRAAHSGCLPPGCVGARVTVTMKDRRKLREEYRELIVLTEENRDSAKWAGSDKVSEPPLWTEKG